MQKIESRSNDKIKYAVSLTASARERTKSGEFLLEGARLCFDAAASGIAVRSAFFTAAALQKYDGYCKAIIAAAGECFEISQEAAVKLSGTQSSQGVYCVCGMPELSFEKKGLEPNGKYIALENIQDPANLGAVCRTAEALGLTGLIVSGGCDLYNPKALRAAMGSSLRMNVITAEYLPDAIARARELGIIALAAVPDCNAQDIRTVDRSHGLLCVVGNEGAGVTAEAIAACTGCVTIPMAGAAESLNAAAAAAILIWEAVRQ